ncbi:MAG: hypothetical protein IJ198_11875 [Lachnospiraceae bacterium]|nr:hypothetical protein [Lachnospiraceae bacterium]
MTYRVIEGFYDLQDPEGKSFHLYNKGDIYPREGLEPTEERIKELSGKGNQRKQPLIEEIPEDTEEAVPEAPEKEEAPKKRRSKKAQ